MAAKKKTPGSTTDNHEFAHADGAETEDAPAPAQPTTRNLTQENLQSYFEQKVAEAQLMEKPPKDLINLDPAKRAAQMVGN
jgi:hypothetical protein